MKPNNYLYTAAALILIAAFFGVPHLLRGAENPDLDRRQHTVVVGERQSAVVGLADAIDPVVLGLEGQREINPFSLTVDSASRELAGLPLPPPPPLRPPEPPALPLASEIQEARR